MTSLSYKEVIINLTAGMGGDVEVGSGAKPLDFGPGTDCVGPEERLIHVKTRCWRRNRAIICGEGRLVVGAVVVVCLTLPASPSTVQCHLLASPSSPRARAAGRAVVIR